MGCKGCNKKHKKSDKCKDSTSDWLCSSSDSSSGSCSCSSSSTSVCSTSSLYTKARFSSCTDDSSCSKKSSSSSGSCSSCGCSSSSANCDFSCKGFKKGCRRVSKTHPIKKYEKWGSCEVFANTRDAIVNVYSTSTLLGWMAGSTGTINTSYKGNGFFITKKHFIVCPAHLVTLSPVIAASRTSPTYTAGQITLASDTYVDVFNVNGSGKSFTYTAQVVGVDGAGDIAVLRIPKSLNSGQEKIKKCHPYLKFGDSLKYSPGNKVFTVGTLFREDYRSVAEGVVRNNKYLDPTCSVVYEGMSTTLPYSAYAEYTVVAPATLSTPLGNALIALRAPDGAPILDVTGRVIGMITTAANSNATRNSGSGSTGAAPASEINPLPYSDNIVAGTGSAITQVYITSDNNALGVSQRFMKCVLRALIKSYCRGKATSHTTLLYDFSLPTVSSATGAFYSYVKGFLGINYSLVNSQFYATNTGVVCRQIAGLNVGDTGYNNNAGAFTGYTSSIISYLNCIELGNDDVQLAPSLVTWRKLPSDKITLSIRPAASTYNSCAEVRATLLTYPVAQDYSPQALVLAEFSGINSKVYL